MKKKKQKAIDRIKYFVEGAAGGAILVAFSGGKDSQACYHLCEDAGIEFSAQYSVTRFEPPELIKFIRQHYPDVVFRRAYKMSLTDEIEYRGLPTRWARWCCDAKHQKTEGFNHVIIGVRWEESPRRRETWRMQGVKRDKTHYLCPICDWTTEEVWEYLEGRPRCSLYDEGYDRIGCVCCPLMSPRKMQQDSIRWPKTAATLKAAAAKFVQRMRAQGFVTVRGRPCPDWCQTDNPEEEFWHRWLMSGQNCMPVEQVRWDSEECLFAGTGFSESDGREE